MTRAVEPGTTVFMVKQANCVNRMEVMLVGVDDRPTYVKNVLSYSKDRTDISITYVSSDEKADIRIPLITGSDIEFLVRFTILVLLGRLPTECDVIHVRRAVTMFPFFFTQTGSKLVTTCPGHLTEEMAMNHSKIFVFVYNIIESIGMYTTDTVIAVSESTRHYLAEKHPKQKNKITVVGVGANIETFRPKSHDNLGKFDSVSGEKILLYAGRFDEVKNMPLLIDVFEKLSEHEDWKLYLAGKGEYESWMREQLNKKDLIANTEFVGHISHESLSNLMNIANW